MLRGDIVKDDSGSYAVFTKQGSCASQMKAAKVMDTVGQGDGVPRHVHNWRRRTRKGHEPACVPALPRPGWYRQVGGASTSSETEGGMTGLPARVSGPHVVRG